MPCCRGFRFLGGLFVPVPERTRFPTLRKGVLLLALEARMLRKSLRTVLSCDHLLVVMNYFPDLATQKVLPWMS